MSWGKKNKCWKREGTARKKRPAQKLHLLGMAACLPVCLSDISVSFTRCGTRRPTSGLRIRGSDKAHFDVPLLRPR
jgi:hypothetical protein